MGLVARVGYPNGVSAYLILASEPQNGQSRVDHPEPHELTPEDWNVLLDQLAFTP